MTQSHDDPRPEWKTGGDWDDGYLDVMWYENRHVMRDSTWSRWTCVNNRFPLRGDGVNAMADAYPVLAPYYPIQSPYPWLDPWLLQDYHGYWW